MPAEDEHSAAAAAEGAPAVAENETPSAAPAAATVAEPAASTEAPAAKASATAPAAGFIRSLTGVVTSSKADKTITVRVDRRVKHPVYGKFIRRSTKLAAHDEGNDCHEGDTVTIVESRPISKRKSWRLAAIVERARA